MNKKLINHIQFLRAISVLLVFFYHLELNFFEYGFIGVDIFFVISGYVIASRIHAEYFETKNFDFYNFFKKRIKRIYPVLFFIFSFSLVFIIFFQPLDLFLNNLKVYIFTILGVSNLYFLFSEKDYFGTVFEDPFGHSWSLGVEEQFYLIFPIFFVIVLRHIKQINKNIILISGIIIIGIIFLYLYSANKDLVFYSPLFRFWQFLLGALTFLFSKKITRKNFIISILVFFSLVTVILNGKIINDISLLLICSILSCLFIMFYKKNEYGKFLFENKFLILLGNISYSFYLWHLPIIYFYNLYFDKNLFSIPLLFFFTLFLSFLTFTYIEEKFRNIKLNLDFTNRYIFVIISSVFIIMVSLAFFSFQKSYDSNIKNNLKKFIYKLNYLESIKKYTDRTVFYKININENQIYRFCTSTAKDFNLNKKKLKTQCLKEGAKPKKLFYLEGDSHTANFVPMMNAINFKDSFYFQHFTLPLKKINYEKINALTIFYDEIIYTKHISNITDLNDLEFISKNFNDKVKILILGPIPNITNNTNPLKCFIKSVDCTYNSKIDIKNRKLDNYYNAISKILINQNKFYFYNPYKIICPQDNCYSYDSKKDILSHRDSSHLTIEGSILLKNDFNNFYNLNFNN